MDPKELKSYLVRYYMKHGKKSLSPVEVAFLKGSIGYSEYLNRCYAEYCNDAFNRSQVNQGALYD